MMNKIIVFLLSVFLFISLDVYSQSESSKWIDELDATIDVKSMYINQKWERIDSLNTLMRKDYTQDLALRYVVYGELFEAYKSFVYDSAFVCANELLKTAYQLKDASKVNEAKVKISFTLLSAGMFKEAMDTLNAIDTLALNTKEIKIEYYTVQARTYFDLSDYANDQHYSSIYNAIGDPYLKKAQLLCDSKSGKYLFLKGWEYMRSRNIVGAINTFQKLLQEYPLTEHEYAIATSSLSFMYRLNNQKDKAKEFLAKAAIADIHAAVCETVAIRDLAELLHREGDVERAHRYVRIALNDAYFYGAKYRKIQIANILPLIESTQLDLVEGQRKSLMYYAIALTILILLVIVVLVVAYKQARKLNTTSLKLKESHTHLLDVNNQLTEANKIKEEYIGHFFKSTSEYLDKLEKIKNSVDRKVSQKKLDEIRDLMNTINLKTEREELYENFDMVFLKIFPHFIEEFNQLFKLEDQVVIEKNDFLPPELRIFALIRLGIKENEKIAQILSYSVNTIYTYKTRVKNKSIVSNELFEEKLMAIKAF